ncbi:DUF4348 domain-containing protein [Dysgonomonas macrotermitis]|uniref:DUF4348 domain-containing protein n=1 Tax=Dysgonomonas macrotermitis TaxID=1346286 RepID=A0A1M5AW43_9BACT|nr:DUF4348 domain-containing protein [Dysgonomonas macrotermitis]SHF34307.1 protein of unknown function [Dysgonomonas macrotermitis]
MRKLFLLVIPISVFIILSSGCKNQQNTQTTQKTGKKIEKQKGENFDEFYSKFFADPKFQLSRVTFPLECDIQEHERRLTIMQKSDWDTMIVPIDKVDRKTYEVTIKRTPTTVSHRIYIKNSDTDILIKYQQIRGKWYLVYYKSIFL